MNLVALAMHAVTFAVVCVTAVFAVAVLASFVATDPVSIATTSPIAIIAVAIGIAATLVGGTATVCVSAWSIEREVRR